MASANCVWVKQIQWTLTWLRAFITHQRGTVRRTFTFEASFGNMISIEVTTDASIYGYGGWISVDNKPLQWFSEDISSTDEMVLGHKAGDSHGQQAFEAMALLLAIRTWSHLWRSKKVRLKLRSDNMGALTVFSACKGASGAMNAVAREYALDAAEGAHEPEIVAHLPGVANSTADVLSRRNDPKYKGSWKPPSFLAQAVRVHLPKRPLGWWRARVAPGSA